MTIDENGEFYSDAAGAENESQSWVLAKGLNTVYVRLPSGSAAITVADGNKVTQFYKWYNTNDWNVSANEPSVNASINSFPNR
jgi:hypothetical protein